MIIYDHEPHKINYLKSFFLILTFILTGIFPYFIGGALATILWFLPMLMMLYQWPKKLAFRYTGWILIWLFAILFAGIVADTGLDIHIF